jgi:hypothetical protein
VVRGRSRADAVAEPPGIGDVVVTARDIAKWPVMLAVMVTMISVLCYASPNVKVAAKEIQLEPRAEPKEPRAA